jgi:hypothetical protein
VQPHGVLGQSHQLWIWAGAGQDLGVASRNCTPALALKRSGDDCRPAASETGINDPIDELDEIVGEPNSDLLAHPTMVAEW